MSSSAFSKVQTVSASQVDFSMLPKIDANVPREVIDAFTTTKSKQQVQVVRLKFEDMPAVLNVSDAEYASGNGFIVHRTLADLQEMAKNGSVFGAINKDHELLAVSAVHYIDDENKAGRGVTCAIAPLKNQMYFKMMITHPTQRGQGLAPPMYTARAMEALAHENVKYCVMKSNNPDVQNAYSGEYGFGWEQYGEDYYLSDEELGGREDVPEHLRWNKTFVIKADALANWLEINEPQAFEKLVARGISAHARKPQDPAIKYA